METVKYLRRKNLGNYEHEELEISTVVEDGQSRVDVVKSVKQFVVDALNGTGPFALTKQLELPLEQKSVAQENKTEKKGESKVTKPKPQAEEKKVEEKKEEAPAAQEETTPAPAEEKKVEEKKAKKETTLKVTKPTKATAYDRNLDTHKALLGQFLDVKCPNWRKPEELKKAGNASRALQGTDFQDAEGNILESFKEAFLKYMV